MTGHILTRNVGPGAKFLDSEKSGFCWQCLSQWIVKSSLVRIFLCVGPPCSGSVKQTRHGQERSCGHRAVLRGTGPSWWQGLMDPLCDLQLREVSSFLSFSTGLEESPFCCVWGAFMLLGSKVEPWDSGRHAWRESGSLDILSPWLSPGVLRPRPREQPRPPRPHRTPPRLLRPLPLFPPSSWHARRPSSTRVQSHPSSLWDHTVSLPSPCGPKIQQFLACGAGVSR